MNSVFSGCMLSLFILIHSELFSNSAWKFCITSPISFEESETSVSSAFENFRQVSKSYNMKSNGPIQEPCGIPHVTARELDLLPFKEQYWFRSFRYDLNHSTSISFIPYTFIFLISISWSTLVKRFL